MSSQNVGGMGGLGRQDSDRAVGSSGTGALVVLATLLATAGAQVAKATEAQANAAGAPAAAAAEGPAAPVANASGDSSDKGPESVELGEVTVTGSRIVRDGYTAPTPLTVVGSDVLQHQATPNMIDALTTLPAFSGNYTPESSTQNVSSGAAGTSSINLRNLGTTRTLVLIDGRRSVPSTVTGLVDVNSIPEQLIQRVEVVTGGASAAYGSDAVAGVVNFILDKKFTGLKGEVSGGITNYGDDPEYKVALTGGTDFADGRGHFILSGEMTQQGGVLTGDRPWDQTGWQVINNPAYTASNGLPQRLLLSQIAASNATPGGIIVSGPLKGIAFGQGGSPYMYNYGTLSSAAFVQGGSWQDSSLHYVGQSIEPKDTLENVFGRASFDLTDSIEVYAQSSWFSSGDSSHAYPNEYFGGLTVQANNAFLPASVAAQAKALGLTTLTMGTWNSDLGTVTIEDQRKTLRNVFGVDGHTDLFGHTYTWNAWYQWGETNTVETATHSVNLVKYAQAIDAVVSPTTGAIVCRSTLTTPTDGCVPYNPFGVGVNSQAAINYVLGVPHRDQTFVENVGSADISGSPFSDWAGPVSFATGIERRTESVDGDATAADLLGQYFAGNYRPTFGSYHVTEEFLETDVPLANDVVMARALDLNGAVRFTDYSVSGHVTTWKAGLTWRPVEDLMLRATRSRDIRAPNLNELFNAGTKVNNVAVNNANLQTFAYEGDTTGNTNLKPEVADTTNAGFVYQPAWVKGLSLSVDYWNIDLKDAISTLSAQNIVDLCTLQNNAEACASINGGQPIRYGSGVDRNIIAVQPINIAEQLVRGVDYEVTYRTPLSNLVPSYKGDLIVDLIGTNYMQNWTNNRLTPVLDVTGVNTAAGTAKWRWNAAATYSLNPFTATLTARGVSAGKYGNNLIQCSTDCPTGRSTVVAANYPTISDNHLPGEIFFDLALGLSIPMGKGDDNSELSVFLNIRNLTNRDPVIVAGGPSGLPYDTVTTNPSNYDVLGRVFSAGVRFKL